MYEYTPSAFISLYRAGKLNAGRLFLFDFVCSNAVTSLRDGPQGVLSPIALRRANVSGLAFLT